MPRTIVAFDLYGTLLSTGSIAQELSKLYGDEKAKKIAAQARRYQLEYTWRLNSMGLYRSFSDLTRWSFRHAVTEAGEKMSDDDEEHIMHAYDGLDTFTDVDEALTMLSRNPSLDAYVFSNGTEAMVKSSMRTSPSLSQASSVIPIAKAISVEPLQVFKPARRTYDYLASSVGMDSHPEKVWLVSSNPFDVAGAAAAGLNSVWVDRDGMGWVDGLGSGLGMGPKAVVRGVDEAILKIEELNGGN